MKALILKIRSNEGYAPDQVTERHCAMTVGDLRRLLEDYDDDLQIVTDDENNSRGANYGLIEAGQWGDEYDDESEDE